jgi:hypothetical protein
MSSASEMQTLGINKESPKVQGSKQYPIIIAHLQGQYRLIVEFISFMNL